MERSLNFYKDGLGLPTKGIVGQEFEHGTVEGAGCLSLSFSGNTIKEQLGKVLRYWKYINL